MFFKKFLSRGKKEDVPAAAPAAAAPRQQTNEGEESSYLYKILLIGDLDARKPAFLRTYIDGAPLENTAIRTIGVEFLIKQLEMPNGCTLKLQIWDTETQGRYKAIIPAYFKGTSGILMCYDPTNADTFECLKLMIETNTKHLEDPNVAINFVGISSKSCEEHIVSSEEVQALADKFRGKVSNCYLNAVESINDVFDALVMDIGRKHNIDFGAH